MTLDHARDLIRTQLQFGGGYNRNAVRLILGEVQREHGQGAVDDPDSGIGSGAILRAPTWHRLFRDRALIAFSGGRLSFCVLGRIGDNLMSAGSTRFRSQD